MINIPSTIKETAYRLRKIGWNVIPLFEYSKNPKTATEYMPEYEEKNEFGVIEKKKGWKPLQSRMATEEEFSLWFDKLKPTGLGVITGKISNIVVIDEDSYKAGGLTFNLDSPIQVQTANGGRHLYFKYSDEIPSTGLKKGVFIEIKSDGGFVVLPPSEVYKKDQTIGKYEWLKAKTEPLTTLKLEDISDISKSDQSEKVVLSELTNVKLGSQHNDLRTFVNSILNKYDPSDWEKFAYPHIRETAENYEPPHPPRRVEKMIKDCSRFVLKNLEERQLRAGSITTYKGSQAFEEYKRLKESWHGGISTTFPELDQFFKFYPGNLYAFSGVTHSGKSIVACNLAARIAATGKRVLYFSLEEQLRITDKINSICDGKYPETLDIVTTGEMLTLSDISEYVSKNGGYDIIFVDHIHFLARKAKSLIDSVDLNVHRLNLLSQKYSVPIVFMSHLRKINEKREPTMDDLKDSQALEGVPSVIVLIHRPERPVQEDTPYYEHLSRVGTLLIDKNRLYDPSQPNSRHTGRVKYTLSQNEMTFNPQLIAQVQQLESEGKKIIFSTNYGD